MFGSVLATWLCSSSTGKFTAQTNSRLQFTIKPTPNRGVANLTFKLTQGYNVQWTLPQRSQTFQNEGAGRGGGIWRRGRVLTRTQNGKTPVQSVISWGAQEGPEPLTVWAQAPMGLPWLYYVSPSTESCSLLNHVILTLSLTLDNTHPFLVPILSRFTLTNIVTLSHRLRKEKF